jgi:hypothetical protein
VIGTSGDDVIDVSADEAGYSVTLNGKSRFVENGSVGAIWSKGGNDKIRFTSDGGGTAVVCAGDGKDTITGTRMYRIHSGAGYDTVIQHLQCVRSEVFAVENVRSTFDSSGNPGPCN